MTDVSVVIPVYNRAQLLPYTLASLRAENHPGINLEVIVIDDGSTEPVDAPATVLVRQERKGAPAARNHGLALAHAPIVMFLDSDDLVEPGFFAPRVAALVETGADGAYGPWDYFVGDGAFADSLVVPRHTPYPIETGRSAHLRRLCGGWYVNAATTIWRRSVLHRVGGQDVTLSVNQDVDLTFRVLNQSTTGLAGALGPRGLIREHGGLREGVVGTSAQKVRAMLELRRQWAPLLDEEQRDALAYYCFNRWREYRRTFPQEAHDFLVLSRKLGTVRISGRWPLRLAGRLLGSAAAARLRDIIA